MFACAESLLPHIGFLHLQQAGATLQLQWEGFSLWWLLELQSTSSRAHGLQQLCHAGCTHGLSSLQHVRSPQTRDRTHIPALAGEFLTT